MSLTERSYASTVSEHIGRSMLLAGFSSIQASLIFEDCIEDRSDRSVFANRLSIILDEADSATHGEVYFSWRRDIKATGMESPRFETVEINHLALATFSDASTICPPQPRVEDPLTAAYSDPDIALNQVRAHLGAGRYRTAQRLAKQAAERFIGHKDIDTMNRGLNRLIASTRPADNHSRIEEFAWLQDPPESARGKLVALVDSKMVASADTMKELMAELESMNLEKIPLIHRIEG